MCDSCNAVVINGMDCHEQGCPDAWRDAKVECDWCGMEFLPDGPGQKYCSEDCCFTDNFDDDFNDFE